MATTKNIELRNYRQDLDLLETQGSCVMSFLLAFPNHKEIFLSILERNRIKDVKHNSWHPTSSVLGAFEEITNSFSEFFLFEIGKCLPKTVKFPEKISCLESALRSINLAYHMNHRHGNPGYYKLLTFNKDSRVATFECHNPYPSEFDRGIIYKIVERFKPKDSKEISVTFDDTIEGRKLGGDSCFYKISW